MSGSKGVPSWRVAHGPEPGKWILLGAGNTRSIQSVASSQPRDELWKSDKVWNSEAASFIRSECTGAGNCRSTVCHADLAANQGVWRNVEWPSNNHKGGFHENAPAQENVACSNDTLNCTEQQSRLELMVQCDDPQLSAEAQKSAPIEVGPVYSPRKRVILTQDAPLSTTVVGNEAKRQKQLAVANEFRTFGNLSVEHASIGSRDNTNNDSHDWWPMLSTMSTKPVQVSSLAMAKAKALLGYDNTKPSLAGTDVTGGKEVVAGFMSGTSASESNLSWNNGILTTSNYTPLDSTERSAKLAHFASPIIVKGGLSNGDKTSTHQNSSGLKDGTGHGVLARDETSQPMFQTATGRSVSISLSAMKRAEALLSDDETKTATNEATNLVPGLNACRDPKRNFPTELSSSVFESVRKRVFYFPNHHVQSEGSSDWLSKGSTRQMFTSPIEAPGFIFHTAAGQPVSIPNSALEKAAGLLENKSTFSVGKGLKQALIDQAKMGGSGFSRSAALEKAPPVRFQTATGRTVSVSAAAMKRAVGLLGGDIVQMCENEETRPLVDVVRTTKCSSGKHSISDGKQFLFQTATGQSIAVSNASIQRAMTLLGDKVAGGKEVDAFPIQKPLGQETCDTGKVGDPTAVPQKKDQSFSRCIHELTAMSKSSEADVRWKSRDDCDHDVPLAEISNRKHSGQNSSKVPSSKNLQQQCTDFEASIVVKTNRRPSFMKSVSSFKAPRRARFSVPSESISGLAEAQVQSSALSMKQDIFHPVMLHPLHPEKTTRAGLEQVFGKPPHHEQGTSYVPEEIQAMTADTAKEYRICLSAGQSRETIGPLEFKQMLVEAGANSQFATNEWVNNHYRWIVWKLASLERSYPRCAGGKLLTIQRILDELKYRYEREINRGHQSALRRILEGDAAAGCMMVLCVSAVRNAGAELSRKNSSNERVMLVEGNQILPKQGEDINKSQDHNIHGAAKLEITDGWYCLNAVLDPPLSRQLGAGKLFVGQKLRVCGATLIGWAGPTPPLEACQVATLVLNINGVYRAHWAEHLGFCKYNPFPLAFHCIKDDGGPVPRTCVGVLRVYPVLYHERLSNGGSITRSARAEESATCCYNERREQIVEEAILNMEKENFPSLHPVDKEVDEGARLYKLLENAAEPELLMADMTAAQHAAFADFQSRREAARRELTEKGIRKALEEAQLDIRDVTPILKVRVTGLRMRCTEKEATVKSIASGTAKQKRITRAGFITIWHPTEKLVLEMTEGAIYCVSDLIPYVGKSSDTGTIDFLQLRATRSTRWQRLPQEVHERFEFSFSPRGVLHLALLGTIPFCSEFDVAVLVVHVGQPYLSGSRRRQWLFVSDGSFEQSCSTGSQVTSLLAIDFSAREDSFLPLEASLSGCIVGICNLIKRHRDHRNQFWVAEASENSVYSSNLNTASFSHLKAAAVIVNNWARTSKLDIEELQKRIQGALAIETRAI